MNIIYGVRKLAKEIGVNPSTIYRWIELGNFPYIQITEKKKAFDVEEVKEWIDKRRKVN